MNNRFRAMIAHTTASTTIVGTLLCTTCSSHDERYAEVPVQSMIFSRNRGMLREVLEYGEAHPVYQEADGYRIRPAERLGSIRSGHWDVTHRPIDVWVPARSDEAMRFSTTGAGVLAVRRVGPMAATARLERGALMFADASASHDVTMLVGKRGIHDLLWPRASGVSLGYDVELPPGWKLHSINGAKHLIEVQDGHGIARLRLIVRGAFDSSGRNVVVGARVSGSSITIQTESAEPAAVHAEWEGTGTLAFDRKWPVATLLTTGKVLVTGELPEFDTGDPQTGELYDPISSTFTVTAAFEGFMGKAVVQLPTGPVVAFGKSLKDFPLLRTKIAVYYPDRDEGRDVLPPSRFFPDNALVLSDGTVFVCGKAPSEEPSDTYTAWLFDPAKDNEKVYEIEASREHHLAGTPVLLSTGKVAIIGKGGLYAIYDPEKRSISGDPIDTAADVAVLGDGRILVFNDDGSAITLNPASGKREPAKMPYLDANRVGIRLASGKVLVVDTGGAQSTARSYILNPDNGRISNEAPLEGDGAYYKPALTYLPGGGVFLLTRAPSSGGTKTTKALPQVYLPAWDTYAVRSLRVPRTDHTATLLASGKLLFAGGDAEGTAEIYDPKRQSSRIVAKLIHPRFKHTANLLLPSGKVLLVGGNSSATEAELFDPDRETFEPVGLANALPIDRGHQATSLASGKVLITGGSGRSPDSSSSQALAQIYDPVTNAFLKVPSMNHGRVNHAATLLDNGNVFIAGGVNKQMAGLQAEVFDIEQNKFVATGPVRDENYRASAARLPSGKVLIVRTSGDTTPEVYDPSGGFAPAGKPTKSYDESRLFALSSGRVVLSGHPPDKIASFDEIEAYDEATQRFSPARLASNMGALVSTVTPMTGERLLLSGGADATRLLLHDFESGQTLDEESSPLECNNASLTTLPDGRILRLGHHARIGGCPTFLFNVDTGKIERQAELHAMSWTKSILLSSGKVFAVGAFTGSAPDDNAVVFDPDTSKTQSWHLKYGWAQRVPTMMSDGRVLLAGGSSYADKGPIPTAELFDPSKAESPFVDVGNMQGREAPVSVLLGTGDVLVAGGLLDGLANGQTLELFEQASMKFVDTKIRGGQEYMKAATRLAYGDALVAGNEAAFFFRATTRTTEYGIQLPLPIGAAMSLLGGDVIAATKSEMVRVTPRRTVIHEPYPIPEAGKFTPLRSGGFLHVASSQWLVSSAVPPGARRPQVTHVSETIESRSEVDVTGKGFSACTAVNCTLGPGSALGPPTVAFLPLDGGGPLVSSVLEWSDTRLKWRVPSSAYHGMGWLYVIVDGVPSEGFRTRLVATVDGVDCSRDAECASGVCSAGMCCDERCGLCKSCRPDEQALGGQKGKCSPIKADTDPQNVCEEEPAPSCGKTGVCDGKGACKLHPDGTTCKNNGQCQVGTCLSCTADDEWVVGGSTQKDCAPFRCQRGSCLIKCSSDADCLSGYACDPTKHMCGATCSADETTAINGKLTTDCHPFRCRAGVCPTECNSNVECAKGHTCELDHRCVPYVPLIIPERSCSVSFSQSSSVLGKALPALAILLLGRRVRRKRRDRNQFDVVCEPSGASAVPERTHNEAR